MTCLNSNHGFWLLACLLFSLHFAQPSHLSFSFSLSFPFSISKPVLLRFKATCPVLFCKSCWALFSFAHTVMIFEHHSPKGLIFFLCNDETLTKANAEENKIVFWLMLPQHWSSLTKFRQELRQEPGGRKWDRDHRRQLTVFFSMACLSCLLTQLKTTCPELSQLILGWVFSHQSINH